MKRLLVAAMLLGSVSTARAQVSAPTLEVDRGNAAQDFSATSAAKAMLLSDLAVADKFSSSSAQPASTFAAPVVATALALPLENAEPASPPPQPKFLYGGRDDYRWELSLAASWLRFRSSVFNASAVGFSTSVVYFTNDWFGVEGNVTAVFAPTIFQNEHVKIATYGAGPKIAWRQKRWEPWLHGIFGGAHEQPAVAGQSKSSYEIKAGGGADYRWNPRISFRLEGDYVRTAFFTSSQNNFQLAGGIVFHF
jgi:hypothetical protein